MTTSVNFREAAFSAETGRTIIALITLTHPDLADPILIGPDPTQRITALTTAADVVYGTISRGDTYIFLPLRIKLPNDADEGPGDMTIEFDNIHRSYTAAIRSIFTPVSVLVELVLDNDLDTVEAQWPEFLLTNIRYDASTISGTLKLETLEREPFPAGTFTPSYFAGLF